MNDDPQSLDLKQALAECARELIHIPGAIQPGGMLLVLDPRLRRVVQASTNLHTAAGLEPTEESAGIAPERLLGRKGMRRLRRAIAGGDGAADPLVLRTALAGEWRNVHARAWRGDGNCVLVELEPEHRRLATGVWLTRVNRAVAEFETITESAMLRYAIAAHVRACTEHDRVMIYAFDEDWHGTVVAESRSAETMSYLGHRFPASDIPPQARAMYANSTLRIIPDVDGTPVPLVPSDNPVTGAPLDLANALYRAVSPVHLQYLRNMDVRSSLSIAMRRGGELWGLVACHGREANRVGSLAREAAAAMVAAGTQRLFALLCEEEEGFRSEVQALRLALIRGGRAGDDAATVLRRHGREMLHLFSAMGIALADEHEVVCCGRGPDVDTVHALVKALKQHKRGEALVVETGADLPVQTPPDVLCGLLAVPLDLAIRRTWLLLFRPERIASVMWAGDPNKPARRTADGLRLSPRDSFASWQEEVRGHSDAWSARLVEAAREVAHDFSVIVSAQEARRLNDELRAQQRKLEAANRKLAHLAEYDGLTGIWNRHRFDRELEGEIRRVRRYGQPFSLLMLDIDRFKAVNDTHGHEVGDQVLRRLAEAIRIAVRDIDSFARWDGEEFVVLAPGTDQEGAVELAERLRSVVEQAAMPSGVGTVTISVGVAAWRLGEKANTLFGRTDEALYAAKAAGRNRVCAAPSADASGDEDRGG